MRKNYASSPTGRVKKSLGRGVGKSTVMGKNRSAAGSRLRTKRPTARKLGRY